MTGAPGTNIWVLISVWVLFGAILLFMALGILLVLAYCVCEMLEDFANWRSMRR